jgi:hypothetical protein
MLVKVVVVSNDYRRDFKILRDKAKELYEKGILQRLKYGEYCLPCCGPCLFHNCKGGGVCRCNCHNYNTVKQYEVYEQ